MAGLSPRARSREQLGAIARLRWRVFINSLRSVRGRLNLVSRALGGLLVLGAGFGGSAALGMVSWGLTKDGNLHWLAFLFWLVFLFWQLFPVMATAFSENIDTSSLLRFPLSYPAYFLVRMIYGALDIATALGLLWLMGLFVGISIADARLAPWAGLVIFVFALFNLLLARMIFVWIEHWLSRRRSREVMGVLFVLLIVALQVVSPVLGRYGEGSSPWVLHLLARAVPLESLLPPGLSGLALVNANRGQSAAALLALVLLGVYGAGVFLVLHLRLRDQYRGENPAGGEKRRVPSATGQTSIRRGWRLPGFAGPLTAIFEKELRYFSRSGPMLFTLLMPLIVVCVMWGGRKGFLAHQGGLALPLGAAYCLLVMTNIVYNSFGGDGGGIRFFLVSPVSFRQIAAAKNLAQLMVLAADVFILWVGVRVIYEPPNLRAIALTLAWYLFAVPVNFAAGNLLSVYSPKRIDYSTFGRQRASETTILVSLGVQLGAIAIGALSVFIGRLYADLWVAVLVLVALSVPAIAGYFFLLSRLDRIVLDRREVLTTELCV
jgi:ABC-2 type transport system permease protein